MFVDWDPLSILFQDLDCRCHESDDRHLPHISPMHGLLDLCGSHTSASLCTVLAMTYATSMRANIGYTCPNISAKTRLSVAFEQLFLTLRESRLLTMESVQGLYKLRRELESLGKGGRVDWVCVNVSDFWIRWSLMEAGFDPDTIRKWVWYSCPCHSGSCHTMHSGFLRTPPLELHWHLLLYPSPLHLGLYPMRTPPLEWPWVSLSSLSQLLLGLYPKYHRCMGCTPPSRALS